MKALVVCTGGGIGDVLLATPVMRALRGRYDEVVALTTAAHRAVLAGNPDLAAVWTPSGRIAVDAARLRAARFDAALVTWASPRAAALPFVAGIPIRVGQARRLYSRLFTHRVVVRSELGDRTTHWTDILLDFARELGCDVAAPAPAFVVDDAARADVRALLARCEVRSPYLVLHPSRGISAARERWPVARLAALARALAARTDTTVVVTGSGADRAIADAVARGGDAISLGGRTSLAEFAALAEGAVAVVAMDSGPMHVAAAVGAPTVGIYALRCDEPDRWAPLGPRTAVVRAAYPCPPAHRKETCPDFACVAALDVAQVIATLEQLLCDRGARAEQPARS